MVMGVKGSNRFVTDVSSITSRGTDALARAVYREHRARKRANKTLATESNPPTRPSGPQGGSTRTAEEMDTRGAKRGEREKSEIGNAFPSRWEGT
jgi:hypothetical protein